LEPKEVADPPVEERALRVGGEEPVVQQARNVLVPVDGAALERDFEYLETLIVADRGEAGVPGVNYTFPLTTTTLPGPV